MDKERSILRKKNKHELKVLFARRRGRRRGRLTERED